MVDCGRPVPDGEKIEDTFIRFDRMYERYERDRRTDRRTDTAWRHRPRLCIAMRQKWWNQIASCSKYDIEWKSEYREEETTKENNKATKVYHETSFFSNFTSVLVISSLRCSLQRVKECYLCLPAVAETAIGFVGQHVRAV